MPLELIRCRNVTIAGFEVDGGVRNMTRDGSLHEAYAHLVALRGCTGVTLRDLDLHHSQTDAILLYHDPPRNGEPGGPSSKNIIIKNVRCRNNARGALAPIQVLGLLCEDCSFNGSQHDIGRYGSHAPGFGVDVEPDYNKPSDVDTLTGDLEFVQCEFNDNASAFLAPYSDSYRGYLRLINCRSSNRHNGANHIIINWPGALIEGGVHDAGSGTIWTSWQEQRGGDLTIRDTEIRTSAPYGIFHAFAGVVTLDGVRIIGTHRGASADGFILALRAVLPEGRKNTVRNCDIFVPAARKSAQALYDYEVSLFHTVADGNLYRTDLPAAGGYHFCTEYGPGTTALKERYRGTAPGPHDSFRPVHFATHDTRVPFQVEEVAGGGHGNRRGHELSDTLLRLRR